jgi:hypothetical protein
LCLQHARWFPQAEEGEDEGPIKIYPHHVPQAVEDSSLPFAMRFEKSAGQVHFRLVVHGDSVRWRLFAGNDWPAPTAAAASGDRAQAAAAAEEDTAENLPPNSGGGRGAGGEGEKRRRSDELRVLLEDYQSCPRGAAPATGAKAGGKGRQGRAGAKRGGATGRKTDCMTEVCLQHVFAKVDNYVAGAESGLSSTTMLSVKDLHLADRITTVPKRKILSYWCVLALRLIVGAVVMT